MYVMSNLDAFRKALFIGTLAGTFGLGSAQITVGLDLSTPLGNVSVGHGSVASVDVGVAGIDVEATIGGNNALADVCVGNCDAAAGGPNGGPKPVPGMPVTTQKAAANGQGRCAGGGNTRALDGVAVFSKDGAVIGWVHDAVLARDSSVKTLKIQTNRETVGRAGCFTLSSAGFRLLDSGIGTNVLPKHFAQN